MPTASAPAQFSRRSSTNTQRLRTLAEALGGQQVDLRLGLVQAHLGGDHHRVEQLRRAGRGRSARCSTSWRPARSARRRAARRADRGDHRLARAACRGTCCRSGPRPRRARGARRSGARTRPPRCFPVSRPRRSASASGILAEQALDGVLLQPLLAAEVGEAVPDRGGQHAAEVDQQPGVVAARPHRIGAMARRGYRPAEASRPGSRASVAGRRAPARLRAHLRRPLQPHLRGHRRARAGAGRCGARRWASASPPPTTWRASTGSSRRSQRPTVPVPPVGRALRGRVGERRALLRHGVRRGPDPALAKRGRGELRRGRAQGDRRAGRRHAGRDPRGRPRRGRARRPGQEAGLRRPPAPPLARAVGEVEDARAAR